MKTHIPPSSEKEIDEIKKSLLELKTHTPPSPEKSVRVLKIRIPPSLPVTTMSTNKFKDYLEKAGVLEVLTESLLSLYEEPDKPDDAVIYLKKSVGGTDSDKVKIERLQSENADLKSKVCTSYYYRLF